MGELPDKTKEALAKELGELKKAASRLQHCLLCQIEGIGRYDHSACESARRGLEAAYEDVTEMCAGVVEPVGLLREA